MNDLTTLIHAYLDGELTDADRRDLTAWLEADPRHVERFVGQCHLHSELCDFLGERQVQANARVDQADEFASLGVDPCGERARQTTTGGTPDFPAVPFPIPDIAVAPSSLIVHASLPAPLSPYPTFVGSALFSYAIATVILGTALAVAWAWKLPGPAQTAGQAVPRFSPRAPSPEPRMQFVGRITGMVDCQWADPTTAVPGPVAVPLGRKYSLASGLMEITYDTGAKVILQGPATYEVESAAGGFLSVGKLTAKLEKKNNSPRPSDGGHHEVVGAGGEGGRDVDSPLSTLHSPLFAVRTPTAIVTDLGTEFGVEVDKQGGTTSHVFRGSVRVAVVRAGAESTSSTYDLHENESVRITASGDDASGKAPAVLVRKEADPTKFVRELPKRTVTASALDIVDLIVSGDENSNRRGRGIDPTTGQVAVTVPKATSIHLFGDGKYHRDGTPGFIDGVFIPDGRNGAFPIDSAGHTFDGFAETANETPDFIWAGRGLPNDDSTPTQGLLGGVDYAAPGHSWLYMHANKGITFDLDAARRAKPGAKLLRFRAVAGNTETVSANGTQVSTDIWLLVDGQVRFRRREINGSHGAFPIVIPLRETDRFLTLAAADAGNGIWFDWIVFGDPRLEFVSTNH